MTPSQRIVVPPGEAGQRLDQALARAVPSLTRSRLQQLIAQGQVLLGGRAVRASHRLVGGEQIDLSIPPPAPAEPEPEALPLVKVFEDRDLLVVNKAAGMVVHPGAGHRGGTLVNALLHHVKDLAGVGGVARPGLVHRLDKDTSGLLVVAKHGEALAALQASFKAHEVEKIYLALVLGHPPDQGTFRTLHARHPTQRLRFTGRLQQGRPAITHFTVRERLGALCLVEVALETGRTHQIRMHFAEAGFPLLADALYGPRAAQRPGLMERQALHAHRLAFPHPRTGKRLRFEAPPPPDFAAALAALRPR